jgi:putative ABC transport system substrate-binding protein
VAVEYRWANAQDDRLPALGADLVRRPVAVIVAVGNSVPWTRGAKAANTTIPIVLIIGGDPVKLGLVANLNRPGGNITGVTTFMQILGPKRLGLLHDCCPAPPRSLFS